MPQPLPNGYVDTGVTAMVTAGAEARVRMFNPDGTGITGDANTAAVFNGWYYKGTNDNLTSGGYFTAQAVIESPQGNQSVVESQMIYATPSAAGAPMSGWQTYAYSAGPFRLGVRYVPTSNTPRYPSFAQLHYRREYTWFGDENTVYTSSFGPLSESEGIRGFSPGDPPVDMSNQLAGLAFGVWTVDAGSQYALKAVEMRGLTVQGVTVDTGGIHEYIGPDCYFDGAGAGVASVNMCNQGGVAHIGPQASLGKNAKPPFQFDYDLRVSKNGGDDLGALVNLPYPAAGTATTPHTASHTVPIQNWGTGSTFGGVFSFGINAAWAAAQNPPLNPLDLALPIVGAKARSGPGSVTPYQAASIALAAPIAVFQSTASPWISSDATKITVSGNTFTVAAAGVSVRHEMAGRTEWRARTTKGSVGSTPKFGIENYEVTKHNYTAWGSRSGTNSTSANEDVWGWESFGFADLSITAPASGTLTLTVEGVRLSVTDPHTTGSDREDGYEVTEHPYTYTYPVPVAAGANTVDLDLLFPNEGGPVYLSRVDAVRLSGFAVGAYTFGGISLNVKNGGYIKLDYGVPTGRDNPPAGALDADYSALWLVVDGAPVFCSWGDQENKSGEVGDTGGGMRYCSIVTGVPSGLITDTQFSIAQFIGQLNKLEGWTATYNAAVSLAANSDGTNTLGPELAQWLRPVVPHAANTGLTFDASPLAAQLYIANAVPFAVKVDYPTGGAVEALAANADGTRAGSGESIVCKRTDTGAVVGTGMTDPSGYVVVTPLPAAAHLATPYEYELAAS